MNGYGNHTNGITNNNKSNMDNEQRYGINKICRSEEEALKGLRSAQTIMLGGFGACGTPEHLVRHISKTNIRDLVVISCTGGTDHAGVGLLLPNKQVRRVVTSFAGHGTLIKDQYMSGELEIEFVPQGTLAEKIRCGGAGIPAFYTPAGYGTPVHLGNIPIAYNTDGSVRLSSEPKESRQFGDVGYVLETAITADFALVKAWKADKIGNLVFRRTAFNFNPIVARAAKCVIAEVEEIVDVGDLKGEEIHVPSIYVDRIYCGTNFKKPFQFVRMQSKDNSNGMDLTRDRIIRRAALEFEDGTYANLGIGLPVAASNYIPKNIHVVLHSENGMLGLGPYPGHDSELDSDLTNAGIETVTAVPGATYFGSHESFAIVRGGHLNLTMLGALEVSQYGDLANWMIPGKKAFGMGGAMDLVASQAAGTRVVVTMEHNTKDGAPKILPECSLPLTGTRCVSRIITEKAVFDVDGKSGLTLIEIADGLTIDDITKATAAVFKVSLNLKVLQQVSDC